ncbi:MAG: type pilus modification protein PilV [Ramlibacter sp.]|jgi:type IV pilus assembly protein PilV|nr:type pilus modification protein PilV [Ramlibacter sp.]
MNKTSSSQGGASLIEVLVAMLILSFGMLSLSGMLAYAVQMPKLSGYRASAMSIAAGHVERMRANTVGFAAGSYNDTLTYSVAGTACTYPNCSAATIAQLDRMETIRSVRNELLQGGMRMVCTGGNCNALEGDLWVFWQEPSTFATFSAASSDECPDPASPPVFTAFPTQPRCVHIKFKL